MSRTVGGNGSSPKRVSKAEVSRVLKDGLQLNNDLRVNGLSGLSSFRRSKAKMQTREQTRLVAKYDAQHSRVQAVDAKLSANIDTISGLRMETNRAGEPREACDERTWTVKGRIYDRKGCPVAGAEVAVYDESGKPVSQVAPTHSDKQGRYQISYSASKERIDQVLREDGHSSTGGGGRDSKKSAAAGKRAKRSAKGDQDSDNLASGSGLRINTNVSDNADDVDSSAQLQINTRRETAVFVRALVAPDGKQDDPLCADSTLMVPKIGNCNYRDLIFDTDRAAGLVSDIDKNRRASRYLGNSATRELHDLKNEKGTCQIDEIRGDHCVRFKSIKESESFGYDFCAYCFGRERSKR
ncbi:carboxypeptidase-like regulatory domain-containing protein [Aliikangiella coralliicola]|uniref:Carboxypeptidase regulatory-like domain-containing protein n=1 Tax=Aliikangiella coralliicola TaxID=2592383 RepID=A0A545UE63_9GAMM|nr:carboxypeptidase-like regulatory domain-containing protein [Aliikangiella coralliicola]TQV87756.1 carboxypeptidase regulatory-like domain-containing protein [Aliikangiella coralliicola]